MRVIPKIATVIVSLTALCSMGVQAREFGTPVLTSDQVKIRRAKLDQIAILVSILSNGSSKLQIDHGAGASPGVKDGESKWGMQLPPVENIIPKPTDNTAPFISVFPVSKPVKANLQGLGEGQILGAVSTFYPVAAQFGMPEGMKAEAGVYLIFFKYAIMDEKPIEGVPTPLIKKPLILLVSLNVDNQGGISYKEVAFVNEGYLNNIASTETPPTPRLTVWFVSLLANIDMEWDDQKHQFSINMENGPL